MFESNKLKNDVKYCLHEITFNDKQMTQIRADFTGFSKSISSRLKYSEDLHKHTVANINFLDDRIAKTRDQTAACFEKMQELIEKQEQAIQLLEKQLIDTTSRLERRINGMYSTPYEPTKYTMYKGNPIAVAQTAGKESW